MIAKINKGASLYGAVAYNHDKVAAGTARIISGNRILTDIYGNPDLVMQKTLISFEDYLIANKRTEKPVVHISLNPDPEDRLTYPHYVYTILWTMSNFNNIIIFRFYLYICIG